MKSNKDRALDVNPGVYAYQDIYTLFWCIKSLSDRNITDWYLFEEDAWGEITKHYSL